jgi:hypothetical protein
MFSAFVEEQRKANETMLQMQEQALSVARERNSLLRSFIEKVSS